LQTKKKQQSGAGTSSDIREASAAEQAQYFWKHYLESFKSELTSLEADDALQGYYQPCCCAEYCSSSEEAIMLFDTADRTLPQIHASMAELPEWEEMTSSTEDIGAPRVLIVTPSAEDGNTIFGYSHAISIMFSDAR
jgi:hypothetical protein